MKKFLALFVSLVTAFSASANSCRTLPTCESLGYSTTVSSCRSQDRKFIRCPFDMTKAYCTTPMEFGEDFEEDPEELCKNESLIFSELFNGKQNTAYFAAVGGTNLYSYQCDEPGSGFGSGVGSGGSSCGDGSDWDDYEVNAVADALNYYAVSANHPTFGRGTWYLPSVGELLDMVVDYDRSSIDLTGSLQVEPFVTINGALNSIKRRNSSLATTLSGFYWTSTRQNSYIDRGHVSVVTFDNNSYSVSGGRSGGAQTRPFNLIENEFKPVEAPNVGEILYSDLSHSATYDNSKVPVGVVAWVSPSKRSVKIVALKNTSSSGEFWASDYTVPELTEWTHAEIKAELESIGKGLHSKAVVACNPVSCYMTNIHPMFDGRSNTRAAIAQLGDDALAAKAATLFYPPQVSINDATFGQGKWYLPAIGEWMTAFPEGNNNKFKRTKVEDVLTFINEKGWPAEKFATANVSSSEVASDKFFSHWFATNAVVPQQGDKNAKLSVRPFLLIEGKFDGGIAFGDIVYTDLSFTTAENYDSTKTPVGVVVWVSESGSSAKIINLKDLTFSSWDAIGNFNPANPYGGAKDASQWVTTAKATTDITAIENYTLDQARDVYRGTITPYTEECRPATAVPNFGNDTCEFSSFWNGQANSLAAVQKIGNAALAAKAALIFYPPEVNASDENLGQGKWYLPAMGELMEAYGVDYSAVTDSITSGVTGTNKAKINIALSTIGSEKAATLTDLLWSSSEFSAYAGHDNNSVNSIFSSGNRTYGRKHNNLSAVRPFLYLENKFDGNIAVGDIVYTDLSYTKAANYQSNKTPVGVVAWVSDTGNSAKILSLKSLTFVSQSGVGNFDSVNPYNYNNKSTVWSADNANVTSVPDYNNYHISAIARAITNGSIIPYSCNGGDVWDGNADDLELTSEGYCDIYGNDACISRYGLQYACSPSHMHADVCICCDAGYRMSYCIECPGYGSDWGSGSDWGNSSDWGDGSDWGNGSGNGGNGSGNGGGLTYEQCMVDPTLAGCCDEFNIGCSSVQPGNGGTGSDNGSGNNNAGSGNNNGGSGNGSGNGGGNSGALTYEQCMVDPTLEGCCDEFNIGCSSVQPGNGGAGSDNGASAGSGNNAGSGNSNSGSGNNNGGSGGGNGSGNSGALTYEQCMVDPTLAGCCDEFNIGCSSTQPGSGAGSDNGAGNNGGSGN